MSIHKNPGVAKKVKITKKVKEIANQRVFESAAAITEQIMKEMLTDDDVNLPNLNLIARAANDRCKRLRPTKPTYLNFELNRDYVCEYIIIDDIHMERARHVLYGSERYLELLTQSRRLFIDGTFKVVKAPFYQVMTIHAFRKKGDSEKQFPFAYVLMSRRSKNDYVEVFSSIRQRLGQPLVQWVMLDFEAATWQALREVYPGTIIK